MGTKGPKSDGFKNAERGCAKRFEQFSREIKADVSKAKINVNKRFFSEMQQNLLTFLSLIKANYEKTSTAKVRQFLA